MHDNMTTVLPPSVPGGAAIASPTDPAGMHNLTDTSATMLIGAFADGLGATPQYAEMIGDLSRSYLEACNTCATELGELAQGVFACRTPLAFFNLQRQSMDVWMHSVAAVNQVYETGLKGFAETMETVSARAMPSPGRFFGAFAD